MPLTFKDVMLAPGFDMAMSLTVWSRLEVLPTSSDFGPALEAQVADPLWFMARQWQFGELQAEDAGSPIEVRLDGRETRVDRFQPGLGGEVVGFDPEQLPIETVIEAEPANPRNLLASALAGLQFFRVLKDSGFNQDPFRQRTDWHLTIPSLDSPEIDQEGCDWAILLGESSFDGSKVAAAIAAANGVPAGIPHAPGLGEACLQWLDWYRGGIGDLSRSSWSPDRLEYSCAAGTGNGPDRRTLVAEEYVGGRLDWYSFDLAKTPLLGEGGVSKAIRSGPLMPTPARYGGMPADRYWEFEDARVNLAQARAGPTDIAKLLLLEFALAYGNDWFLFPLDLPIGSLFRVEKLKVVDTFGRETMVGPASRGQDPWRMFELSSDISADRGAFFLAPSIHLGLEGDPLEEVGLFRDEMANMAWGVERKTQGKMGLPVDRYRAASLAASSKTLDDLQGIQAELIYRVATSVPENWIPFVPVPVNGRPLAEFGIELERRAMQRPGQDPDPRIHPDGILLRSDPSVDAGDETPLRLKDEEVPRQGVVLTRSSQFTRWTDGSRLHWTGRRKASGRGEGNSGLEFDTLVRRTTE